MRVLKTPQELCGISESVLSIKNPTEGEKFKFNHTRLNSILYSFKQNAGIE